MNKTTLFTLALSAVFMHEPSMPNTLSAEDNESSLRSSVELVHGNGCTRIQFFAPGIVRVTKWASGTDRIEPDSISVIASPNTTKEPLGIIDDPNGIGLSSDVLQARIDRDSGAVSFSRPDGTSLLDEAPLPAKFEAVTFSDDQGYSVRQNFKLEKDVAVFGLGQHQGGLFNYRGHSVKLVQTNTDAVNPFLISTTPWGILWDNYSQTIFSDDPESGAAFWSEMGDAIDYYFVAGDTMDEVIAGYRKLTGTAPMYGLHAYGYWQSKEHYDTQAEIMAVAEKYRELGYPIDNMIQDWDYWNGAANWSGMFFDKDLFPDPEGMCRRLHELDYRVIISIWPAVGPATEIYADMDRHGFLYQPVGWAGFKYYDAFNPEANKLYWKYLRDGLYSKGLDGWWIDSTEPDVVNALTKESTAYEMKRVGRNHRASWARTLNAFSLVMTDDIHRFWREETSDRRAYILTRSTYAGQQRNAATTWSGDIGASWKIYRDQISAGTNHCMSGIPYWTFDIGAFVLGAYEGVFNRGGKDPAYQEFYTRMFQLGAFTPIFRSHGSETPREIWEMGEFTDAILKYDHLRYRLLPYIYSQAWRITNEHYTLMRGLPMDFAHDPVTHNIDDQFMFGPSILVSPVTEPMIHRPPSASVLVSREHFRTPDGKTGLIATYHRDAKRTKPGLETIDPEINVFWYTGRPEYASIGEFAIRWEGKLIPSESGPHQFHLKSFDAKRIRLDGEELPIVYTSVEQYTAIVELEAGRAYEFELETENTSTGAARMQLFWKTPAHFAADKLPLDSPQTRRLYLPSGSKWVDFWTGEASEGGQYIVREAPVDLLPLHIRAGTILPMGPFIQHTGEKPADPIEWRIYTGADASFTLYEDEGDNYNYEKGVHSTIRLDWNDASRTLSIGAREGEFPGMLEKRTFRIVLVSPGKGIGVETEADPNLEITYQGRPLVLKL